MVQKTAAMRLVGVRDLIDEVLQGTGNCGQDITEGMLLDAVVTQHQLILSEGYIEFAVPFAMLTIGQHVVCDERMQLINGIATYHRLINRQPKPAPPDWLPVDDVFSVIEPKLPLVKFLVLNYRFLCLRNAEQYDQIAEIYDQAIEVAEGIADLELRREHMGYITYNNSRLQLKLGNVAEAKELYMLAGVHRTGYLQLLRNRQASRQKLLSAAQQVAKLNNDWPALFAGEPIAECPVTDVEFNELVNEFGDELRVFFVKK